MDEEDEHSPSELYYPEDLETFDVETETSITECHIITNLLTELSLGNIGPRSWRRTSLRSVCTATSSANISQYGPRARLVSG